MLKLEKNEMKEKIWQPQALRKVSESMNLPDEGPKIESPVEKKM